MVLHPYNRIEIAPKVAPLNIDLQRFIVDRDNQDFPLKPVKSIAHGI
jgi:hypothetical protein